MIATTRNFLKEGLVLERQEQQNAAIAEFEILQVGGKSLTF